MKKILPILELLAPLLFTASVILRNLDSDNEGADDRIADALQYAYAIVEAISKDEPVPTAPPSLVQAT
ncbi:MAG TPA: hypothetical protein VNO70_17675 [Blastocatellia bacterium]|nr:hypothetical protein [Blastocatellia bacterium]